MLRSWVLGLAQGVPVEGFEDLAQNTSELRAELNSTQIELNLTRQSATRERDLCNQMINRLSEKLTSIEERMIAPAVSPSDTPQPLNSRQSWPSLKRRLERNARENRSADEQIALTEQYWKDKGAVLVVENIEP